MKVVQMHERRYGKGRSMMGRSTAGMSRLSGHNGTEQPAADRAGELAVFIKEHREKHGLSQEEFAEFAGVSRSTLSNIERGHIFPSGRIRRKLAQAMGVSPAELWQLGGGGSTGGPERRPEDTPGYERAS